MSHLRLRVKSGFKLSTLALCIGLSLVSSYGFALEALDDDSLADSTGEGIAFLPENFSMQFNGADDTVGTGYIRLIPVGPLTTASQDTNKDGSVTTADYAVGKADIYLYGFAISQSNNNYGEMRTNLNSRFDRNIDSWGSGINPWIMKVITQKGVPDFAAASASSTSVGDVSYLALEAPLFHADTDNNFTNGINAGIESLSSAEKAAYNLKLGFWVDAFIRDPSKAEGDINQFALGQLYNAESDTTRANRIRLQAIWDGFSLNGSNLKLFQTLGGVSSVEVSQGLSTSYNNTLGIAGLLRLNGGDGQTLRGTATSTVTKGTETTTALYPISNTPTPNPNSGCEASNGGASSLNNFANGRCLTQERVISRNDITTTNWTAPSKLSSVLRLSTKEKVDSGVVGTPALGGDKPQFADNEGIYIYNLNANLVLGNIYQPLILNTDGNNITFEITRIPNKASIYQQIYTAYPGLTGALSEAEIAKYTGSTCNIYKCGNTLTLDNINYQGSTATHSSITIGSTEYDSTNNLITAHKGIGAVGISFGPATSGVGSYSTAVQQVQSQARRWNSTVNCASTNWVGNCNTDVNNYTNSWGNWGDSPTAGSGWRNVDRTTVASPQVVSTNGIAGLPTSAIQQQSAPSNNFGSAVIDGLLIQHMKITTKGL